MIIFNVGLNSRRVSFLCDSLKRRVLCGSSTNYNYNLKSGKSQNILFFENLSSSSSSTATATFTAPSSLYKLLKKSTHSSELTRPNLNRSFVTQIKIKPSVKIEEEKDTKEGKMSNSVPNVVFVLGGPGAGKGTQCSKIVEEFGFVHLSAGDLLREERNKPGSEYGELIERHIRDGTIVPVEITCSLIDRAMSKNAANNFLIDGFPRNQNNLDGWEKEMTGKATVLFVLFFDAPEDVCVGRCLSRGEAGSGRSDDNPESMKKRVLTYVNETMPIIQHFQKQDLVHQIDASKDAGTVFEQVRAHFDKLVAAAK